MFPTHSPSDQGYQRLESSPTHLSARPLRSRIPFLTISTVLLAAIVGFYSGTLYSHRHSSAVELINPVDKGSEGASTSTSTSNPNPISLPIPLSPTSQTFHYNASFGAAPSNTTNTAWHSLFPTQGGFFRHPSLALNGGARSAFAVFHQLHCLDGIRHGYHLLLDAVLQGTPVDVEGLPMHTSPLHMRHCLDLLRQGLMCRPDLTVERKDEEAGGVTGFGTEHVCLDWGELKGWVGRWEGWKPEPDA